MAGRPGDQSKWILSMLKGVALCPTPKESGRFLYDCFEVTQRSMKHSRRNLPRGAQRSRLQRGDWPTMEGAELFIGHIYTSRPGWISFVEEQAGIQPDN